MIAWIVDAEVAGRRCDVALENGRVRSIGERDPTPAAPRNASGDVLDARGGALLPGLHDHHIHLMALAAALEGVDCGPPRVADEAALARALRTATPREGWLRGTRYHESVAGALDRGRLDRIRDDVAIRLQHRSGIMWFLNSKAIAAIGLDGDDRDAPPGAIERDAAGRATGRLFRADAWLRRRLGPRALPDLARVGRRLAAHGVTRVTDCSPDNDASAAATLAGARRSGALPQRIDLMGRLGLAVDAHADVLHLDAHKIMLDEPALPDLDALTERIAAAHAEARGVAFHAVTRTELLFALTALEAAGARAGDRLEHASVAPPEIVDRTARLGLRVVTQPHFVSERGDDYLRDVEARDRPHLYRLRSWRDRGVVLAGGTDAPYGAPDPWAAMRAATTRRSASDHPLGEAEALSPEAACALFAPGLARTLDFDGRRPPSPRVGDAADLCLLTAPWREARESLETALVRTTIRAGRVVYDADA